MMMGANGSHESSAAPLWINQTSQEKPRSEKVSKQSLKQSCDACARGKVKCPKEQPNCQRCASKGFTCTYSAAQRYGKRSRSKKQLDAGTAAGVIHTIASSSNQFQATSQTYSMQDAPFDGVTSYQRSESLANPNLAAFLSMDTAEYGLRQESVSSNDGWSESPDEMTDETTDEMTDESVSPVLPGGYQYSLDFPRCEQISRGSDASLNMAPSRDAVSEAIDQSLSTPPFVTGYWNQPSHYATQDCFKKVCEAFQHLKKPQDNVCLYDASNGACLNNGAPEMGNIGDILRRTSEAMSVVSLVIKCPCHATSKVRCAMTLLLLDVVAWYETIAKGIHRNRNPNQNHYNKSQHDLITATDGALRNEPWQPDYPSIQIGSTMLASSDAHLMLSQVILFKMRQIRNIMQKLSLPPSTPIVREQVLNNLAASLEAEMLQDPIP